MRTASTRDGYAVQHAAKCGMKLAMISGGRSEEVVRRMNGLGVGVRVGFIVEASLFPATMCVRN